MGLNKKNIYILLLLYLKIFKFNNINKNNFCEIP